MRHRLAGLAAHRRQKCVQLVEPGIIHGLGLERKAGFLAFERDRKAPGHLIQDALTVDQPNDAARFLGMNQ
ncbi:hypothetical protein BF95_11830 [Sphingobium sp. Ant17]|nr:hypothetical protein BF95_11830 [Sphingobium sp. Ant17]